MWVHLGRSVWSRNKTVNGFTVRSSQRREAFINLHIVVVSLHAAPDWLKITNPSSSLFIFLEKWAAVWGKAKRWLPHLRHERWCSPNQRPALRLFPLQSGECNSLTEHARILKIYSKWSFYLRSQRLMLRCSRSHESLSSLPFWCIYFHVHKSMH